MPKELRIDRDRDYLTYKKHLLKNFGILCKEESYDGVKLVRTGAIIKLLDISKPTLYTLIEKEGLPYYLTSAKHKRFDPTEVMYWLKCRTERMHRERAIERNK